MTIRHSNKFYDTLKVLAGRGISVIGIKRVKTRKRDAWLFGIIEAFSITDQNIIVLTFSEKYYQSDVMIPITAHEYGHIARYRKLGAYKLSKQDLIQKRKRSYRKMSAKGKKAVYTEEVEAWKTAKRFLQRQGYTNWTAFDKVRDLCLRSYVVGIWNQKDRLKLKDYINDY